MKLALCLQSAMSVGLSSWKSVRSTVPSCSRLIALLLSERKTEPRRRCPLGLRYMSYFSSTRPLRRYNIHCFIRFSANVYKNSDINSYSAKADDCLSLPHWFFFLLNRAFRLSLPLSPHFPLSASLCGSLSELPPLLPLSPPPLSFPTSLSLSLSLSFSLASPLHLSLHFSHLPSISPSLYMYFSASMTLLLSPSLSPVG